jgi:hypothetical protein
VLGADEVGLLIDAYEMVDLLLSYFISNMTHLPNHHKTINTTVYIKRQ